MTTKASPRLEQLFQNDRKNILSLFFTAGYPELDDTGKIMHAVEQSGADLVEIGMPYSDPLADGPVIQQSSEQALRNGMRISYLFKQIAEARKTVNIPIVLMGYLNPVLQFGMAPFLEACRDAGVDGVILPDLPPELYLSRYRDAFEKAGIPLNFLISPQTPEKRIRVIDEISHGFIYAVSSTSTTGNQARGLEDSEAYLQRISDMALQTPVLTGFNIKDAASFNTACRYSRGAIIGTTFLRVLEQGANEERIGKFIQSIRNS